LPPRCKKAGESRLNVIERPVKLAAHVAFQENLTTINIRLTSAI
jgi:hypothetical protein